MTAQREGRPGTGTLGSIDNLDRVGFSRRHMNQASAVPEGRDDHQNVTVPSTPLRCVLGCHDPPFGLRVSPNCGFCPLRHAVPHKKQIPRRTEALLVMIIPMGLQAGFSWHALRSS